MNTICQINYFAILLYSVKFVLMVTSYPLLKMLMECKWWTILVHRKKKNLIYCRLCIRSLASLEAQLWANIFFLVQCRRVWTCQILFAVSGSTVSLSVFLIRVVFPLYVPTCMVIPGSWHFLSWCHQDKKETGNLPMWTQTALNTCTCTLAVLDLTCLKFMVQESKSNVKGAQWTKKQLQCCNLIEIFSGCSTSAQAQVSEASSVLDPRRGLAPWCSLAEDGLHCWDIGITAGGHQCISASFD